MGYKLSDCWRLGLPLSVLIVLVSVLLILIVRPKQDSPAQQAVLIWGKLGGSMLVLLGDLAAMARKYILYIGALCLFVASFYISWSQPFPHRVLDEHGHYSYTRYLDTQQRLWPDFMNFPLLRADGSRVMGQDNFINHPPNYYWPSAWLGIVTPEGLRAYSWVFYGLAIIGYVYVGLRAGLSGPATTIYAAFPLLMSIEWIIGYYSNDAWAMLGGVLLCYGSLRWLGSQKPDAGFGWMGIGLLFGAAKMTGFLLLLLYIGGLWLFAGHKRRSMRLRHYAYALSVILLACIPYLYFLWVWGSPVPNSPGQIYLLQATGPSVAFHVWLIAMLMEFGKTSSAQGFDLVGVGITMLLVAWVVVLCSGKTKDEGGVPIIVRASCFATFAMLTIHIWFSYDRFVRYKWVGDFYARYYLPLLAPYALSVAYALMLVLKDWKRSRGKAGNT